MRPSISAAGVVVVLLVLTGSVCAQGTPDLDVAASIGADKVTAKETVSVTVAITNNENEDLTNVVVSIYIYSTSPGEPYATKEGVSLPAGETTTLSFPWTPSRKGTFSIIAKVTDETGTDWVLTSDSITVRVSPEKTSGDTGMPTTTLLILVVVVAAAVGGGVAFAVMRKKKKSTGVESFYSGETDVTPQQSKIVWGKMPENYYAERRERLAKLKPIAMTQAGVPILGTPEELPKSTGEAAASTGPRTCPKCGIEMQPEWKSCLNCNAREVYKDAEEFIKGLDAQGVDVTTPMKILAQARDALEKGSYVEAEMFAEDAKSRAKEAGRKHAPAAPPVSETRAAAPEEEKADEDLVWPDACPNCGMGLQKGWRECPACKAEIHPMPKGAEVEQAPEAQVQSSTCQVCGTPLSEDGTCPYCTTKSAVDGAEAALRELQKKMLSLTPTQKQKEDMNELIGFVEDAKGALRDGDYQTSKELAEEAGELAAEIEESLSAPAPEPEPEPEPEPQPETVRPEKVEIESCPNCGKPVKPKWNMCPYCETMLQRGYRCPKCGASLKEGWKICPSCGVNIEW